MSLEKWGSTQRGVSFCFLYVFLSTFLNALAADNIIASESNPVTVTATLNKACADVVKKFDAEFQHTLRNVPFIKMISRISETDWQTTASDSTGKTENRKIYYSVNTTVPKLLPYMVLPLKVTRYTCAKTAKSCTSYTHYDIDGAESLVYKASVDFSQGSNGILSSFSASFYYDSVPDMEQTCSLSHSLNIKDNKYIVNNLKLFQGANVALAEKHIGAAFLAWATSHLEVWEK